MIVRKFEATNAVDFLKYAEIYSSNEVKRIINNLYNGIIYILGLEIENNPIGFLVIERRNGLNHVCNYFFLKPEVSKRRYENVLIQHGIDEAKEEGAEHFYISYFAGNKDSEKLKKLYETFGFKPSGYERHTFVMDREEIGQAIQRLSIKYARYLNLRGKKVRAFKDLDSESVQLINSQRGNEFPDDFYPLSDHCCPECSTMIWQDDDPAGWIVFETNGKTALYVYNIFIKEKYRNKGLFVPLLTFAYNHTPKAVKRFFFYVNGDNNNMLGLLRLFPDCTVKQDVSVEMTRSL